MDAIKKTFFNNYRGRWFTLRKVALVAAFLALPLPAFALTLEWDRNTEPDMKEYRVYLCTPTPCTVVAFNTAGVVAQPAVGVKPSFTLPTNVSANVAVLAIDNALNRSPLSVTLTFSTILDTTPPASPTNLLVR